MDIEEIETGYGMLMPEMGVFERVGMRDIAGELGSTLMGTERKIEKDPIEIFKNNVVYVGKILELTDLDIDTLLKDFRIIEKVQYMNPACFILGYIANRGGKGITTESVNRAFESIFKLPEDKGKVTKADIIRYARMWARL